MTPATTRVTDRRTSLRFEIVGRLRGSLATSQPVRLHDISPAGALVEMAFPLAVDSQHAVQVRSTITSRRSRRGCATCRPSFEIGPLPGRSGVHDARPGARKRRWRAPFADREAPSRVIRAMANPPDGTNVHPARRALSSGAATRAVRAGLDLALGDSRGRRTPRSSTSAPAGRWCRRRPASGQVSAASSAPSRPRALYGHRRGPAGGRGHPKRAGAPEPCRVLASPIWTTTAAALCNVS